MRVTMTGEEIAAASAAAGAGGTTYFELVRDRRRGDQLQRRDPLHRGVVRCLLEQHRVVQTVVGLPLRPFLRSKGV